MRGIRRFCRSWKRKRRIGFLIVFVVYMDKLMMEFIVLFVSDVMFGSIVSVLVLMKRRLRRKIFILFVNFVVGVKRKLSSGFLLSLR